MQQVKQKSEISDESYIIKELQRRSLIDPERCIDCDYLVYTDSATNNKTGKTYPAKICQKKAKTGKRCDNIGQNKNDFYTIEIAKNS